MMKTNEKPIVIEQTFDCSIEKVWNAITSPNEMKQWYFDNMIHFEAVVGFETRFDVQVEDRIFPHLWKVTEVINHKKLSYSWRFDGYQGSSLTTFTLSETEKQTRLKLTSTVIENFQEDIPEFERSSAVDGWKYFINKRLREYLENA